jgi:hypothetical protein
MAQGTQGQTRYIFLLEQLTGMRTKGAAGRRIRQLQREARRQGIPEWYWKPAPVRRYFDPSIRTQVSGDHGTSGPGA